MKISTLLLATLTASTSASALASVDQRLVAQIIAEEPLQNLRGLKKKSNEAVGDVTPPEDSAVEEPVKDVAAPAEGDRDEAGE